MTGPAVPSTAHGEDGAGARLDGADGDGPVDGTPEDGVPAGGGWLVVGVGAVVVGVAVGFGLACRGCGDGLAGGSWRVRWVGVVAGGEGEAGACAGRTNR